MDLLRKLRDPDDDEDCPAVPNEMREGRLRADLLTTATLLGIATIYVMRMRALVCVRRVRSA